MWYEERIKKFYKIKNLSFLMCCMEGKVRLVFFKEIFMVLSEFLNLKGVN